MSLSNFKLSADNPNESIGGGGCACSPVRKASDCEPPYVVFHNSETADNASPHVVVCHACLHAAEAAIRAAGDDISPLGRPVDMAAKLAEQPEPTVEWSDLTEAEREQYARDFPGGGLVKLPLGDYVNVPPADAPTPDTAESVQADAGGEDPLVELVGEAPQEEPGTVPGEYVPVKEDTDE